ncbi:type VI secretion system tip protein TssI/VgrG [Bordetella bronchiseptica]
METILAMAERIVRALTPRPPQALQFRSMHGHEGLSALYEFEVDLLAATHTLELKSLLGKPVSLEIETGGAPRYLSGQATRCALVGREGDSARQYVYRVTMRPWLWYLTQTSDSKIFQQMSVVDVLRQVLADYPFPVEYRLAGSYRRWEYCVQYQETDFAFVSRLMEHEGIYYWFRHESGKHTLVLTDDITQHDECPGAAQLPYYGPDRATVPQEQYVSQWQVAEEITPDGFATVDYDFKKPAASLDAQSSNPGAYEPGGLQVYEWLGGYTEPDQGERYSRIRLEALQAHGESVTGACNVRAFAPGYLFTLRNHPRPAENRQYLIAQAHYRIQEGGYASGAEDAVFDIDFRVLPATVPFRVARATPVPRTHGPQTATVVGQAGEEIWTDEYGRVKVHFHWDRYGKKNENSSCWVRVSSPWAGGGFGGIQLPRVGDEVIVDFIGGYPDRPIVIGRVYNASNMPPWDLPGNATQSGFLSRSKNGDRGTANALMFEDSAGAERIWLHAERDMDCEVEANESHTVDGNRTTLIGGNDTLTVRGTRTTTIDGLDTETFNAGATRTVTGEVSETTTGNETRTFNGDVTETVNGVETRTVNGDWKETITGEMTETRTGDETRTVTGAVTETITGDVTQTITGAVTQTQTGAHDITITGDQTSSITGAVSHTVTGAYTQTVTDPVTVNANTSMTVVTPSWTVSSASQQAFWTANTLRGTPARLTVVGAAADFWGVRQQVYGGINSQWSTVKIDLAAFKNGANGFESGQAGAQIKAIGAQIKTGGAAVISRVINLFT